MPRPPRLHDVQVMKSKATETGLRLILTAKCPMPPGAKQSTALACPMYIPCAARL